MMVRTRFTTLLWKWTAKKRHWVQVSNLTRKVGSSRQTSSLCLRLRSPWEDPVRMVNILPIPSKRLSTACRSLMEILTMDQSPQIFHPWRVCRSLSTLRAWSGPSTWVRCFHYRRHRASVIVARGNHPISRPKCMSIQSWISGLSKDSLITQLRTSTTQQAWKWIQPPKWPQQAPRNRITPTTRYSRFPDDHPTTPKHLRQLRSNRHRDSS